MAKIRYILTSIKDRQGSESTYASLEAALAAGDAAILSGQIDTAFVRIFSGERQIGAKRTEIMRVGHVRTLPISHYPSSSEMPIG